MIPSHLSGLSHWIEQYFYGQNWVSWLSFAVEDSDVQRLFVIYHSQKSFIILLSFGMRLGQKIQILPFLFLKCVFYNHHLLAGVW